MVQQMPLDAIPEDPLLADVSVVIITLPIQCLFAPVRDMNQEDILYFNTEVSTSE